MKTKQMIIASKNFSEFTHRVSNHLKDGWRVVPGSTYFHTGRYVPGRNTVTVIPKLEDGSSFETTYTVFLEKEE